MRVLTKTAVTMMVAWALLLTGTTGSFADDDATVPDAAVSGTAVSDTAVSDPAPSGSAMSASQTPLPETRSMSAAAVNAAAVNPVATRISLTPGLKGFDNIGVDSPTQLSCLSAAGYSFDVIDALGAGWDTEYRSAAAIGMSAVLFQGFYQPFWSDPSQGAARGKLMVTNAQSVGYPQGAQVYLNLENNLSDGTNPVTRATIIAWVKNWVAVVKAAGYQAGIYVGVPQVLTTADLDSIGSVVFWRSASSSAPQVSRGYVMRQPTISKRVCNDVIDIDTSGSDNRGAALVGAGFPRPVTTPSVPGAIGPVTPARILDTRNGGTLPPLGTRSVQILGAGGVPASGVSAVVANITAVNPTAGGHLTAWPSGSPRPNVSNLNFNPGQTVPNLAVVPVGADGRIQIFNGSAGTADLIIDVAGYYLSGTPTAAGAFGSLTPTRILDTRGTSTLPALGSRIVQIRGAGGVPSTGVAAVVVNITAVNPTAGGYLTAWPSGVGRPTASNLNFNPGQTVPNLAVVPVGADGKIQIFNGAPGSTDVIIDVAGYYLSGTPTAAGALGSLTPTRILDTRGTSTLPALTGQALAVLGRGGVPASGVSAVVLNVTEVAPAAAGYVTAWPSGKNRPNASNLNFGAGQTLANLVVLPVGLDGKVMFFNGSGGSIDLVADVVGYIRG